MSVRRWCIIIPAYNEASTLRRVLRDALGQCAHVIVVDDGSLDATASVAMQMPVRLIRHTRRQGKAAALHSGFLAALGAGFDGVVTMDADGQHAASDVPRLIEAATRRPDHIIIAARLATGLKQTLWRRVAHNMADLGVSIACGMRVRDSQSGQRYYPRSAMQVATRAATSGAFVLEQLVLIDCVRQARLGIAGVPIQARHGDHFRNSYFRPMRDGSQVARALLRSISGRDVLRYMHRGRHNVMPMHGRDLALPEALSGQAANDATAAEPDACARRARR